MACIYSIAGRSVRTDGISSRRLDADGRDEVDFSVSIRMDIGVTRSGRDPLGTTRYSIGKEPGEVMQGCSVLGELGMDHIAISLTTGNIGAIRESVDMLADTIIPRFK